MKNPHYVHKQSQSLSKLCQWEWIFSSTITVPVVERMLTAQGQWHVVSAPTLGTSTYHSVVMPQLRVITSQENEQIDFCSDTFLNETSLCITHKQDCRQADSYSLGMYNANFQHSPLHLGS